MGFFFFHAVSPSLPSRKPSIATLYIWSSKSHLRLSMKGKESRHILGSHAPPLTNTHVPFQIHLLILLLWAQASSWISLKKKKIPSHKPLLKQHKPQKGREGTIGVVHCHHITVKKRRLHHESKKPKPQGELIPLFRPSQGLRKLGGQKPPGQKSSAPYSPDVTGILCKMPRKQGHTKQTHTPPRGELLWTTPSPRDVKGSAGRL